MRSRLLPTIDEIAWVVTAVRESEPATVAHLAASLNMSERQIEHTLRFLSVQARPHVTCPGHSGREWSTTKALWDTGYGDHRAALIDLRQAEWEVMRRYRLPTQSGPSCLMKTLLRELDDPSPARRCGRCSVCLGRDLVAASIDPHVVERADLFLAHALVTTKPKDAS
jgi:ATP-dependent DNA helicase RecQ